MRTEFKISFNSFFHFYTIDKMSLNLSISFPSFAMKTILRLLFFVVIAFVFSTNNRDNYKYNCLGTIIMQSICMYEIMQIVLRFYTSILYNSHSHPPYSKSNLCRFVHSLAIITSGNVAALLLTMILVVMLFLCTD